MTTEVEALRREIEVLRKWIDRELVRRSEIVEMIRGRVNDSWLPLERAAIAPEAAPAPSLREKWHTIIKSRLKGNSYDRYAAAGMQQVLDDICPAGGPPMPSELKPGDVLHCTHDGGWTLMQDARPQGGIIQQWPAPVKP